MNEDRNATDTSHTADAGETPALERRFRRLLRVYPRWYRRHRGDELLGTLLDGAVADQTRATPAQRRDIIRNGLATWLRIRGGAGPNIVAALLALTAAVVGSCVGAWMAWLTTPDLPSKAEASGIVTAAFEGVEPGEIRGDPAKFAYITEAGEDGASDPPWISAVIGDLDYDRGQLVFDYGDELTTREWDSIAPGIDDRLEATGWHVTETNVGDGYLDPDARSLELTAVRGDYEVTVETYRGDSAFLWFGRAAPPGQPAGLIAGAVVGLLAGWLCAARIAWQVTVVNPARKNPVLILLTVAFQAALLPLLATGLFIGMTLAESSGVNTGPPWWPFMAFPYRPLYLLAAIIATVALVLAAIPARPRPRRAPADQPDAGPVAPMRLDDLHRSD